MKIFAGLLTLIPMLSFANSFKLPDPVLGEEVCFIRTYSEAHLKRHPKQKISGVALSYQKTDGILNTLIEVKDLKGNILSNGGVLLSADGQRTLSSISSSRIAAQMDGDSGRVAISQSQKDSDKIRLKVMGNLLLLDFEQIGEDGSSQNEMVINKGSEDSIMILNRIRVNGSISKSCSQVLEDAVAE